MWRGLRSPAAAGCAGRGAFQQPQQEQEYQREQQGSLLLQDRRAGGLACFLTVLSCARYWSKLPGPTILRGLAVATLYLAPWAWCCLLSAPDSYARHRAWVVSGLRLLSCLIPQLGPVKKVIEPLDVPSTPAGWLAALTFACKIPRLLIAAVAFRLPFRLHCLVHTLHLVLHLRDLPTMCAMSFFTHDAVSRFFARTAELLALIGAVVGFAGGISARSAKADPALQGTLLPLVRHPGAQCDCVLVVGTLQVLLGFLLPSFALLVWERASRAAFVAARRQQHWSQADLHQHLFYDWLPPWVAFVSAQPLLISLVWHVVVLAAFQAGVC